MNRHGFICKLGIWAAAMCVTGGGMPAAASSSIDLFTTPLSDGDVVDFNFDGGTPTFDSAGSSTHQAFSDPFNDTLFVGILEFEIPDALTGVTISDVDLQLQPQGTPSDVTFFLYEGNGSVEVSDATATGVNLGTFSSPLDSSLFTPDFSASAAFFQTLADSTATHFGLRFEVNTGPAFAVLGSDDTGSTGVPPTLTVAFVPEPASLMVLGLSAPLLLRRLRGVSDL